MKAVFGPAIDDIDIDVEEPDVGLGRDEQGGGGAVLGPLVTADVEAVVDPSGNVHATADYQKHLAGVLTRRALRTAYQRALHAA